MKGIWYAANRDLIEWGGLVFMCRARANEVYEYSAFFRVLIRAMFYVGLSVNVTASG